jgi:cation diffusion facilitator CzcD-associated flavoprotein CzcO
VTRAAREFRTLDRMSDAGHDGTAASEHVDVLIVGAGISGIGAGYHMQQQCPERSFMIVEAMDSFGGTWLTHRYPGVRSDSDLYTFGYRFKPWTDAPIASAGAIRQYMSEVIAENDLDRHIRYGERITNASWSSEAALWTIDSVVAASGEARRVTTSFLWMCQGYYHHEQGYTPEWPGMQQYRGQMVHPQTWPDDLDLAGKQVVCIGSGATAATVVPAIADTCAHVTVLQRSPTFFYASSNRNELADTLREIEIDETWIHEIVRRKVLHDQQMMTSIARDYPELAAEELIKAVAALLPEGFDVAKHFTPAYRPWQQRVAFVPDGDFFQSICSGQVSMVTDEIDTFTETGIRTKSGEQLDADVIITATGFNLKVLGGIDFRIDGRPLDLAESVTYRGMMFTGVPNLVWVFGYFRASWTLRADLISDFVCRLLGHLDGLGARRVVPKLRAEDADMPIGDWIDEENFNPNYLKRSMHLMPKRGDKPEWQHTQDYWIEKDALPLVDLDDGCLMYD